VNTTIILLVTKWDRFSRNIEESYSTIRKLKALGVEVNTPSGKASLVINESKAKYLMGFYNELSEICCIK